MAEHSERLAQNKENMFEICTCDYWQSSFQLRPGKKNKETGKLHEEESREKGQN